MADKPYREMTDDELSVAYLKWSSNVAGASGWPSAYFAAKQLEQICREGERRGAAMENPYPIRRG
jgi:hypothetical protein